VDEFLNLTSIGTQWPCNGTSITDFWQLSPELDNVVLELEDQLCRSGELVDEIVHLPLIFDIIDIVSF
jgi:hypothetical protein